MNLFETNPRERGEFFSFNSVEKEQEREEVGKRGREWGKNGGKLD